MNDLLAGLVAFFVAPAAPDEREPVVHASVATSAPATAPARNAALPPAVAPVVAAIAHPDDLWPASGLVAADLRRRCGAPVAVVCAWTPTGFDADDLPPLLAFGAARRMAARLSARDLDAVACGAVCRVRLPADTAHALGAAIAVVGAVDAPVVVALGLNHPAFAELISDVDEVVLLPRSDADPALTELVDPAARIAVAPAGLLARERARLGLGRSSLPGRAAAPIPAMPAAAGDPSPASGQVPPPPAGHPPPAGYAPPRPPILRRR